MASYRLQNYNKWPKEELTWHYYTNIVAQLIQSKSRMNWHYKRFDFNFAHVWSFETIKIERKNPKCLMLSVN